MTNPAYVGTMFCKFLFWQSCLLSTLCKAASHVYALHCLGVAFGEMHLLPEPLFTVPTDNIHILSITGAENGRIFMTGKDGCLYELAYQVSKNRFIMLTGYMHDNIQFIYKLMANKQVIVPVKYHYISTYCVFLACQCGNFATSKLHLKAGFNNWMTTRDVTTNTFCKLENID